MNLITDQWIPVRDSGGELRKIRPDELSKDILRVEAPRPEISAALTEFLIALCQTGLEFAEPEWKDLFDSTPYLDFSAFEPFFNVAGDGPRAFQSLESDGNKKPVQQLIFGAPGAQTIKYNKDIFQRAEEMTVGAEGAAMLLVTRLFHETGLGGGFPAGVRGPAPLTTILTGRNLWETVCLNLIPDTGIGARFPWSEPTSAKPITPKDLRANDVLWAMAGRFRLEFESLPAVCSITGESVESFCSSVWAAPKGNDYKGLFPHPLSPIKRDGKKIWFQRGKRLTFDKHVSVVGKIVSETDSSAPADVISRYYQDRSDLLDFAPSVWAFGFHANQASIQGWNEYRFRAPRNPEWALKLSESANAAASVLFQQVWRAINHKIKPEREGFSWVARQPIPTGSSLYYQVRRNFFERVDREYWRVLESESNFNRWIDFLGEVATEVFEENAAFAPRPKEFALARAQIRWFIRPGAKTFS